MKLNPYSQPVQRTLVAAAVAQRYIDTFPEDRMMTNVLVQIRAAE